MQIPDGLGDSSSRSDRALPSSSGGMSEVAMRGKRPRSRAGGSKARGEVTARGRSADASSAMRRGPAAKLVKVTPHALEIFMSAGRPTKSHLPRDRNQGTTATSSSLDPAASSSSEVLGRELGASLAGSF